MYTHLQIPFLEKSSNNQNVYIVERYFARPL